jgi:hypothetical protein
MIWLIHQRQKNLIAMIRVLLKTETDSNTLAKIDLTSAINPPKMSPKKAEWDTSQSTPKSFKK